MSAVDPPLPPRAPATAAELDALREGAAVATPGLRSVVAVDGPDHLEWLDRISSRTVADLPPGRCVWATLMDGKGKLRCDWRILRPREEGGLLLDLPASHHAALLRVLDMYILREKVVLTDLGASHRFVSVLGPRAGEVLAAAGLPQPAQDEVLAPPTERAEVAPQMRALPDDVLLAAPSGSYGVPGTDLLVPADSEPAFIERLVQAGGRRVGLAALDVERIARGVPWFAPDLSDGVIPLEAGLDEHVSITKGCYPGQEVVARISNLGQVARRLVRLSTPGNHAPATGTPLLGTGEAEGREAGKLTSAAYDPTLGRTLALGYARRAFWTAGTLLAAGGVQWEVAPLR
jgi:folate-binding protein YgfZ